MSIKEDEKALMTLDEEIRKSSNKALQLERADATDIDSFKALQLEKQFLGNLEKKRLEVRKKLEEEKEELTRLMARLEASEASLAREFEEKATPFIENLKAYLTGDLRDEFLEIYDSLAIKNHQTGRIYAEMENLKGSLTISGASSSAKNQMTLMARVTTLFDTWESETRKIILERSTKEVMRK